MQPFTNCTTIIVAQKDTLKQDIFSANLTPVLLLIQNARTPNVSLNWNISNRFSVARRLIPSHHCWAYLTLFPERDPSFADTTMTGKLSDQSLDETRTIEKYFNAKPFMMSEFVSHQYIIFLTEQRLKIQTFLNNILLKGRYVFGLREILIINVAPESISQSFDADCLFNIYYQNVYRLEEDDHKQYASNAWWHIVTCSPGDQEKCYKNIVHVANVVADRNKYFWTLNLLIEERTRTLLKNSSKEKGNLHRIANQTTFRDFMTFLVFEEMLSHDDKYISFSHSFYGKGELLIAPRSTRAITQFTLEEVESLSFVSCYQVKPYSSWVSVLSSPFDKSSWISLSVCFAAVAAILSWFPSGRLNLIGAFVLMGISLENSVLGVYQKKLLVCRWNRFFGLAILIGGWTMLCGTLLTNWYKTVFTMEMILPVRYPPPWTSVMNIDKLEVIMPFQLFVGTEHLVEKGEDGYYRLLQFYAELQMRLPYYENEGQREMISGYGKLAAALYDMIDDFISDLGNNSPGFDLRKIPIRPIWYNETGRLIRKLSSCGKVAYFDKKKNIASLIPFLNDNIDQKTYLSGEDTFFKSITGWKMEQVRGNYAMKRLSRLMSSGIYLHWENWFNLIKPRKMFHHFANWTYSKHAAVAKLDFKSKIVTAFYSYGVCIVVCVVTLGMEILIVEICNNLLLYLKNCFFNVLITLIVE